MKYTVKQVSKLLDISERTVMRRSELLKFLRRGFKWEFTEDEFFLLKDYLNQNTYVPIFRFSEDGNFLIIQSKL